MKQEHGEIILASAKEAGKGVIGFVRTMHELNAYFDGEVNEEEKAFIVHCLRQAHVTGVWVVGAQKKR